MSVYSQYSVIRDNRVDIDTFYMHINRQIKYPAIYTFFITSRPPTFDDSCF